MVKSRSKAERIKSKGALALKRRSRQTKENDKRDGETETATTTTTNTAAAAALKGPKGLGKERKSRKREKFLTKLVSAQNNALKAKAAIGKKTRKRRGVSKALQDFSQFRETLDSADLSPKKRGMKAKTYASKCNILVSETDRLAAVISHPVYQMNPLKAIQTHLDQRYIDNNMDIYN